MSPLKNVGPVPIFTLQEIQTNSRRDEFQSCLEEHGIFYLRDYGMVEQDHEEIKSTSLAFFEDGSKEEKLSVIKEIPGIRRGYSKLEAESTAKVTDTGDYSDYSMCYSMGISDNLFPSKPFEKVWTTYFDKMFATAQAVSKCVLKAAGIGYSEDEFDEFLECEPVFRFRYFPEVPVARCAELEPLRMAPHYDLSIITLIHQTPCKNGFVSLQYDIGGSYVDLPYVPDTLLVMCGSVSTILSNGKIKAPIHRVVAPSSEQRIGSARTSSVFFLRPKSNFSFSIPKARELGFKLSITGETGTFGDWIGGNYNSLHTKLKENVME